MEFWTGVPAAVSTEHPESRRTDLPLVLAGPLLRRTQATEMTLWLALTQPVDWELQIERDEGDWHPAAADDPAGSGQLLTVSPRLHYLFLHVSLDPALPEARWVGYRLALRPRGAAAATWCYLDDSVPGLCYPGKSSPGVILSSRVASVLHGSCRKPHYPGGDGLARADAWLRDCLDATPGRDAAVAGSDELGAWPSLLALTGDQVYVDDVAGPMLHAIHQVVALLDLPDEALDGVETSGVDSAASLYRHPANYYRRDSLLPQRRANRALLEVLFGGVEKPIFTTANAQNHLITLGEMLAAYLLSWSPVLWDRVDLAPPEALNAEQRARYAREREAMEDFVSSLPAVRRLLAHVPVAMIFDDHDITDDWNLSREWEEVAYGHPFSRRVIGNALLAYLVHQGWGNAPGAFPADLMAQVADSLRAPGSAVHERTLDRLFAFDRWHYSWPTQPPLVVVDTRTHRWRAERTASRPSGLLDWEALTDLQQSLRGLPAVLLVSPTPIFGVKLIETIQRIFTWLGQPLMVDAENWMAHPGSAHAILNIFRHSGTPEHFVVLSGDVHYSFVYDVELRGRVRGPDIWQICSSGVRNAFPERLLGVLDHGNRWLYSPRSPLNWFTRRRHLRITPRKPEGTPSGRRLLNGSGVGLVELTPEGVPWRIRQLLANGETVVFQRREAESRWD